MADINIPRISGIDPKIVKILEPIKLALEELRGTGPNRALRFNELGTGFKVARDGTIEWDTIVVPSVIPGIQRRIEALEAVQTDVSTLADELLGSAQFGTLLAGKVSDSKTLKVNVEGHVAGYGVAVYGGADGPTTSDFIIQADRFSVVLPAPAWLASHAYTLGQYVTPTTAYGPTGFIYEVTTAGTTGATEPVTWPTTAGNTVSSGSVVFTTRTIDERVPFTVGLINGVKGVGINGDLLVDGTIAAAAIEAGSITADKIAAQAVTAEKLATNLVLANAIEISSSGYIRSGQTAYDTGTGWYLGNDSGTPKFSIGNSSGNKVTWNGTTLTVVGNVSGSLDAGSIVGQIPPENFDISALGWTMTNTFSATDADTVEWTSGTLLTAAGTSYSISSGNTGNMTARTYIFLDINVSTTAFQTTTNSANAVGAGRILVAVAEDDTTTAFYDVLGGSGSFGAVAPEIPSFGPLANGNFETGTSVGWATDASWAVSTTTLITGSTYCARVATSSTGLRSDPFAVAAGDRLLVTCIAQRDGGSTPDANLTLQVRWEDSSGALVSTSSSSSAASGTSGIQFLRLILTAPSTTARAKVVISKATGSSGHWFVDDVFVTPMVRSADVDLSLAAGVIDLGSQISGTLTTAFAAAGLINSNVTINANGTLSGAGGGQASLNSLPGTIALGSQVSGTLSTAFAAAGLINSNVTVNADGTLSGAGGGQVSLTSLPGTVAAGQIAANAVTTVKLAAAAVTAAKIDAGTITANEIAAATITGNRIAANTIAAANIVALTITAAELAASSVTTSKLAAQAVTANEIAANTITSGQIAAATIVASNIAASSITGSRIAAATITGTNIAAGTLTAVNIATGTLTANEIAANAITANQIATGAVTAAKLAANLIYAGSIEIAVGGHIRSGQGGFRAGTGWYIGTDLGVPVFSIGVGGGAGEMYWDGNALVVNGQVNINQDEIPFGVNWQSGWSVNPPGLFWARISGKLVFVRCEDCFGTSNSGFFAFDNWPVSIRPPSQRQMIVSVYNQSVLQPATLTINADGTCGVVPFNGAANQFAGNGTKGFTSGSVFTYSL